MEERGSGSWSRWTMLNVQGCQMVRGSVGGPYRLRERPYTTVLASDGTSYDVPLTGLDWAEGDELVVTRVIDGEGDLYLKFVRRKPANMGVSGNE